MFFFVGHDESLKEREQQRDRTKKEERAKEDTPDDCFRYPIDDSPHPSFDK